MYIRYLLLLLFTIPSLAFANNDGHHTLWQVRDMIFCGGNPLNTKFDGNKSTVTIPGDNSALSLTHTIRYINLAKDDFILEFGKVSPWINWELHAVPAGNPRHARTLIKGTGGGTYRAPLSRLGYPRWIWVDMQLQISADKPGTMEIMRWAVETDGPDRFAEQHHKAAKKLRHATPLERGLVPHWNPEIGGFVCAYNPTHPEHYNYWLEDEGEMLWSFGNYPKMMELYGKGLRDFIVENTKLGAPVRKINDQPLMANPYLGRGKFWMDTGILTVDGDLSQNPRVNLHNSVYESNGLQAVLGNFFISYQTEDGATSKIDFTKPSSYKIDYDKPSKDRAQLTIESGDAAANAEFIISISRGRVTLTANITNNGKCPLKNAVAGFDLLDCDRYYKQPLSKSALFDDVLILYADQHRLKDCTIVRLAGPAVKHTEIQTSENGKIKQVTLSADVSKELLPEADASLELAHVNAGSASFADKIEMYKDVDVENADISLSYVCTYPLLGLATYCYRYPKDKEAAEVRDMMIENLLNARDRLWNRELGYLLWVLDLTGRDKDAKEIADFIEKRAEGTTPGPLEGSGMAIGLRRAGHWEAADKICASINQVWDNVALPTDFLGFGGLQSQSAAKKCYSQFSGNLRIMYWDEPNRLTAHSIRIVEEAPEETQSYTLLVFDLVSRLYGGIVPIRLDCFKNSEITNMSFDEKSREWRAALTKASEIDIFTHFRTPKQISWNGSPLSQDKWKYSKDTGVICITGLDGDGKLALTVNGDPPKDDPAWPPIDYLGLNKRY